MKASRALFLFLDHSGLAITVWLTTKFLVMLLNRSMPRPGLCLWIIKPCALACLTPEMEVLTTSRDTFDFDFIRLLLLERCLVISIVQMHMKEDLSSLFTGLLLGSEDSGPRAKAGSSNPHCIYHRIHLPSVMHSCV